jgi:hypothetical protein
LTMGEPVWSWISGVLMPSGCTMLLEPMSPMLPRDAFLSTAGTRFSIWFVAEDCGDPSLRFCLARLP